MSIDILASPNEVAERLTGRDYCSKRCSRCWPRVSTMAEQPFGTIATLKGEPEQTNTSSWPTVGAGYRAFAAEPSYAAS